jgi:hypothetical protein
MGQAMKLRKKSTFAKKGLGVMVDIEIYRGTKLIDDYGSEWVLMMYQGGSLRAFHQQGMFLSEAEADTLEGIIKELQEIEEIVITNIIWGEFHAKEN